MPVILWDRQPRAVDIGRRVKPDEALVADVFISNLKGFERQRALALLAVCVAPLTAESLEQ